MNGPFVFEAIVNFSKLERSEKVLGVQTSHLLVVFILLCGDWVCMSMFEASERGGLVCAC